jgi:protein-tyrosine phosphatase
VIDLHCHILPGVDDGSGSAAESVAMAKMAFEDGIRTIVATPHTLDGTYLNPLLSITRHVLSLQDAFNTSGADLRLCVGADVHLCPGMAERIQRGEAATINNTGRYFLLELPPQTLPSGVKEEIFSLKIQGITPIITHPERHPAILRDMNLLYDFIRMGALSQLTAMSLTGEFGVPVQQCSQVLLKHRLVHVIASDAHSADRRPPILSRAVNEALELTGSESFAISLVKDVPAKILAGEPVEIPEPVRVKRSVF